MNEQFKQECEREIAVQSNDRSLIDSTKEWIGAAQKKKYSYHFEWLGRPIIQYPQDIVGMQEILWRVKPDLVIETGIAHGGSMIFFASMLELNALCGGPADAKVVGVDIDIRPHNRVAIEAHPLSRRISLIQGSSIDAEIVEQVKRHREGKKTVLVSLDSNHTHDHVFTELKAYAPMVTVGSYCVVFDTVIEDLPAESLGDRPWFKGNSPKTAVWKYVEENKNFEIDRSIQNKLLITVSPDGFLKRVR